MLFKETFESTTAYVNTYSIPAELKITDVRFADIDGAPMHCSLIKIYTNQGLVGYGEVRDAADKRYALMLKCRLLGENPNCWRCPPQFCPNKPILCFGF